MAELVAGVGDIVVSRNVNDCLKTYALGSCVAVIIYAPAQKVAALAHVALPDSSLAGDRSSKKAGYFADTSIPEMVRLLKKLGIQSSRQVWVKLVGGANLLDSNRKFDIGKRNVLAIRKQLWKYRLGAIAEAVGGKISRTVSVNVKDGRVEVFSPKTGKTDL